MGLDCGEAEPDYNKFFCSKKCYVDYWHRKWPSHFLIKKWKRNLKDLEKSNPL